MIGHHTIPFYLLTGFMALGVLQSLFTGGLFFFKSSGIKQSNYFFGALLICFGLTLLHNILILLDFYHVYHPELKFIPIYFSLSFPVLLFYYVKLDLYPAYRLRLTDTKHFILPAGQFVFLAINCWLPLERKMQTERYFYSPFYGAMEQFLYLSLFFAYLYFARRYIVQRRKVNRDPKQVRRLFYLRKLVKILFILFVIHAIMVVSDFVAWQFFQIDMRTSKSYVAMGVLSFTALVLWVGTYGFQVLLWGRKVFGRGRR